MSPRGQERRREPRYKRQITLRTISDQFGLIELESADIGPGGAYCISPRGLPEMERLEVMLFLPDPTREGARLHYPLRINSVVVRSEEEALGRHRVALFFPQVSDEQRAVLNQYLPDAGVTTG
jgi:hypothetical protein